MTVVPPSTSVPRWDRQRRELLIGTKLVKRYRVPAPNQEAILMAFEEEGWPPRIDDPLSPEAEQDSRRRLHDAIKNLNNHQRLRLIRFCGDGTGEGVLWEWVDGQV